MHTPLFDLLFSLRCFQCILFIYIVLLLLVALHTQWHQHWELIEMVNKSKEKKHSQEKSLQRPTKHGHSEWITLLLNVISIQRGHKPMQTLCGIKQSCIVIDKENILFSSGLISNVNLYHDTFDIVDLTNDYNLKLSL